LFTKKIKQFFQSFLLIIYKMSRCPKGYRKHRKTGKCTSKRHLQRTRRCKNGTRRSKKTGHCETRRGRSQQIGSLD
jgi:hypothetical protein